MKYLIMDKTSNTGRNYIDHNFENCELKENAILFDTKQEAVQFLNDRCPQWSVWAVIKKESES